MTKPRTLSDELGALRATVIDAFHRNRRIATALLAAVVVVFGISALRGGHGPTEKVWVAAHNLSGGEPLRRSDLALEAMPRAVVPAGALVTPTAPVGVMLGAPVRRGEPLTDVRVLSPYLLAAVSPRAVAVPVRVTDGPAALALVTAGERVAVIAAADNGIGSASARTIVGAVRVLAVPHHATDAGYALVIVAASARQASRLAAVPAGDRISIAVRR